MHDDDRYDEVHADLASGEGMPEARQTHPLPCSSRMTFPPGVGKAAPQAPAPG